MCSPAFQTSGRRYLDRGDKVKSINIEGLLCETVHVTLMLLNVINCSYCIIWLIIKQLCLKALLDGCGLKQTVLV